jgi:hypothetical protein
MNDGTGAIFAEILNLSTHFVSEFYCVSNAMTTAARNIFAGLLTM